jgi:hypothetical protein
MGFSQKIEPPLVLATPNQLSTRHRGFILIRLSDAHLPEFSSDFSSNAHDRTF